MGKRTQIILLMIIGMVSISVLLGCASGPKFGRPDPIQQKLNAVSSQFPIDIAGKQVRLFFEGDYWRGQVNGEDAVAGECTIVETSSGADITLNQSWVYVDSGKTVPITKKPIGKWQKTPGADINLVYKDGPPASISKK